MSRLRIGNVMDRHLEGNEPFLMALGRLVTAAAMLDTELAAAIEWLLETREPTAAEVITAALDFRNKANVLGALAAECGLEKDRARRVAELAKRAHALHDERNLFIHGFWRIGRLDTESRRVGKVALHGGVFKLSLKPVRAEEINALADQFVACAQEIDDTLRGHLKL